MSGYLNKVKRSVLGEACRMHGTDEKFLKISVGKPELDDLPEEQSQIMA
jgi:hypothetical protein